MQERVASCSKKLRSSKQLIPSKTQETGGRLAGWPDGRVAGCGRVAVWPCDRVAVVGWPWPRGRVAVAGAVAVAVAGMAGN